MTANLDALFKTSMFIRRFAPQDRRLRASRTKPFDSRTDKLYVKDKFPRLIGQEAAWLADRLGEANARRRQYFKYRRDHHERLASEPDEGDVAQELPAVVKECIFDDRSSQGGTKITSQTKPSILAETEATAFEIDQPTNVIGEEFIAPAPSIISFATSIAKDSEVERVFPAYPPEADDGPFSCPYCFTFQQLRRPHAERQWR